MTTAVVRILKYSPTLVWNAEVERPKEDLISVVHSSGEQCISITRQKLINIDLHQSLAHHCTKLTHRTHEYKQKQNNHFPI